MIYLDNNSTTPPLDTVIQSQLELLSKHHWGNPSSDHQLGSVARLKIESIKESIATKLGIESSDAVGFTSGGSEANHKVISHIASKTKVIAHSSIEHSSVIDGYDPFLSNDEYEIISIPVTAKGTLDLDGLEKNLIQNNVGGLSIQWANSETGVIQPIAEIIQICSRNEVILHVDAAQAMGRINLAPQLVEQVDFLTFTAHKIHSLKGLGVICCGKEKSFEALFPNPHTLNSPAIFALEPSLDLISEPPSEHLKNLRDSFEKKLKANHPELIINGNDAERLPNTTNLSFVGVDGAALVTLLDQHDVICSQLSACLIGRPEPSYVLTSMGIPEDLARSSIRFSFSKLNTEEEVETAVEIISKCYSELLTKTQLIAS